MKISRPSPSMVVAGIALFVSLGGTSIAAVNYVSSAGAVDGKSAVFAGASLVQAAGKLVATNRSGADKGRLPGKFVADVAEDVGRSATSSRSPTTRPARRRWSPRSSGLGTLTATCNDQNAAAGNEDPISTITFNNASGRRQHRPPRRQRRRRAHVAANQTATLDRDRRLEHVHVPHRAPSRTRSSAAACARTAAGRPRPPASSSAS